MSELEERLRRWSDAARPVTLDEAKRPVPRRPRHRSSRRSRLIAEAVVAAVAVVGVVLALVVAAGHHPQRRVDVLGPVSLPSKATPASGEIVAPKKPGGLAVAPDGTLYVVDMARDQVLRRLSDGRFAVFAGTGRQGFSGDGGPATAAELRLTPQSGLAVGSDGTVYISDTANNRVRAVSPAGIITTVAGDGSEGGPLPSGDHHAPPAPALTSAVSRPAGLTIGPDGELYISTATVERLTPDGTLVWVAGEDPTGSNCDADDCERPSELNFLDPLSVAFDADGDLFVATEGQFKLYELTPAGAMRFIEDFRGDGEAGELAAEPDGTIVEAWRAGITLREASGASVSSTAKLDAALNRAASVIRAKHQKSVFIGGDGVAVGSDGDIYADTDVGNAFTAVSAILRISPTGHVTILWSSPAG